MSEPFEFEGDEVTEFTAQLPSASLEAPAAYPRGTILTLNVQVRVKSVRLDEDRKGNLSRKHILAFEDVSIADVLTPEQRRALIAAAEQHAADLAAGGTITEEEHLEDVLPGQTTIEEQLAEAATESASALDLALQAEARGEKLTNEQIDDAIEALLGDPDPDDDEDEDDEDDDDHEHDWMDEEEDFAHGVRVEVGL